MGHYFNTLDRRKSHVLGGADASKGEKISKAVVDGAHGRSLGVLVLAWGFGFVLKTNQKVLLSEITKTTS